MAMRRSRIAVRIFAMGLELKIRLPISAALPIDGTECDDDRTRRVGAMADSLVEMFGTAALSVARSQPGERDVAGKSGICWCEITQLLWVR